ncbi:hypothetical protein [Herbiconiux sp. UC225_62]|uniref:hypothetical protein n=1 Tax=Herbiconiux sp. UC225_62 TaxID=3350168 RepID=UPI0036D3EF62
MSAGTATAKGFADIPANELLAGTYIGNDDATGLCIVDTGNFERVTIPNLGFYLPLPGDPVRVWRIGNQMLLLGPAKPKPPEATVEAFGIDGSGALFLDARTTDGVLRTHLRAYDTYDEPAIGDLVAINWPLGGIVEGRFTSPAASAPVNPTDPVKPVTDLEFPAIDSGSWRSGSGWWTAEVWSSDTNTGAWFYGTAVADTIPDAATITRIQIYLPRYFASGGAPTFGVHSSPAKPGGNVAVDSAVPLDADGWVDLPLAFGEYLKSNPGGIGTATGGYHKYRSVSSDGLSGRLRISWS